MGGEFWSGDYWGVAFGDHGVLYGLQHRREGYYASVDTVNVVMTGTGWMHLGGSDPVGPSDIYQSAVWDDLLSHDGFDLTRLTVVPGTPDVVYVGSRKAWLSTADWYGCLPGGLFQFGRDSGGQWHWRHVIGRGSESAESVWAMDFTDPASEATLSVDLGWLDVEMLYMTVPMLVHPQDHQQMLAWMVQNPLRSTDGGATWHQVNADLESDGWRSRGANLMASTALAMTPDGRLVSGDMDWGVFVASDSGNRVFQWWNRNKREDNRSCFGVYVHDNELYSLLEVETGPGVTTDTYSIWKLVKYSVGLDEPYPGASLVDYEDLTQGAAGQPSLTPLDLYYQQVDANDPDHDGYVYWVRDIAFPTEDVMFATCTYRYVCPDGPDYCHDGESNGPVRSDLWRAVRDPNGDWAWDDQPWNNSPYDVGFRTILSIPGTTRLLVAADQNGMGHQGGLYCFDSTDPTFAQVWLDGENDGQTQDAWLRQAANIVNVLACDREGTVLYVGTKGIDFYDQSSGNTIGTGTVLRLAGPFDRQPAEGDWEILANGTVGASVAHVLGAGDTFHIGQNEFHDGADDPWPWTGDNETARRMTEIKALVVDPRDPRVVYAGLVVDHMHPANGVWRFDGSQWQQLTTGSDGPSRGVSCLVQDPTNPARLYAGTYGQELFEVTVPEVPEASKAMFVDRSADIYDNGQGLNYQGDPYADLALDYDGDGDQDLLVSIQDGYAQRFEHDGSVKEGVPRMWHRNEYALSDNACRGLSTADFDNDGRPDVFVAHRTAPKLLHNIWTDQSDPDHDPVFEDVAPALGLDTLATDSWCGAWGDYDRDGQVDLFVGRAGGTAGDPLEPAGWDLTGRPNLLLRNRMVVHGDFTDRSGMLANVHDPDTRTVTASWVDIDADGDLDLFVGDVGEFPMTDNYSALYINRGDGTLVDETDARLLCELPGGQGGVTFRDYDLDGKPDMFVAGRGGLSLYLNYSDGRYDDKLLDLTDRPVSATLPLDFDLDDLTDYLALPHGDDVPVMLFRCNEDTTGLQLADRAPALGLTFTGRFWGRRRRT